MNCLYNYYKIHCTTESRRLGKTFEIIESDTAKSPPKSHLCTCAFGISFLRNVLGSSYVVSQGLLSARLLNRPKSVPWRSKVTALLIPLPTCPRTRDPCAQGGITHKSFSLHEQQVQQVPALAGSLTSWAGKFSSSHSRHILDILAPGEQGPAMVGPPPAAYRVIPSASPSWVGVL